MRGGGLRIGLGPPLRLNSSRTSRANYARNTVFAGGVVPSTVATGHVASTGTVAGLTTTLDFGVENGVEYAQLTVSGTAVGGAGSLYRFSGNTDIAARAGAAWTAAVDIRLTAGSMTGFAADVAFREGDAAGTQVALTGTPAAVTGTQTRFSHTITAGATTERVAGQFRLQVLNGVAVNGTFRVYRPQVEIGSTPTAYIKNTSTTKEVIA